MSIQLLWADDDGQTVLEPLGRMLVRRGQFRLIKAASYSEARDRLAESRVSDNARITALLVDTILPHGVDGGALRTDLGITLAEKAAQGGVASVVFLSVIRLDEVIDKYDELDTLYPHVAFSYFDKATLFEPGVIDNLIEELKRSK